MATSAGGAHPNEDFVGAVPRAVVLLDGAGMPGTESICRHGVQWYAFRLGGILLELLTLDDDRSLSELLAEAIRRVTDEHRGTCDVSHTRSPSATAAIVRERGDRLDHLVLGDSTIVFDRRSGPPVVVTDSREIDIGREVRAAYEAAAEGSEDRARAMQSVRERFAATRNRAGGFWMAKDDPHAAAEAAMGDTSRADVTAIALLTNGISRLVDPWGEADWLGIMGRLARGDDRGIVSDVRRAESRQPGATPDDATLAYVTFDQIAASSESSN